MNALRFISRLKFISPARRIEIFPPFWFMRVKVLELHDDFGFARIRLPLNVFSKNMGNSMFGGNQASLADPVAALACVRRFPEYSIWTRALFLDFIREGNSHLELRFEFPEDLYEQIKSEIKETGRSTPVFKYGYYRQDGLLCTQIENTVAIRPKKYSLEKSRNEHDD